MTRQIYLHRLKEALEGLPREEQESAMRYCEEYFDEAGLMPISRNLRNGRGR
mgnify:CR=1 FL=1